MSLARGVLTQAWAGRAKATALVNTSLQTEHLAVQSSWRKLTADGAFPHLLERIEAKTWERVAAHARELDSGIDALGALVVKMRCVRTSRGL